MPPVNLLAVRLSTEINWRNALAITVLDQLVDSVWFIDSGPQQQSYGYKCQIMYHCGPARGGQVRCSLFTVQCSAVGTTLPSLVLTVLT